MSCDLGWVGFGFCDEIEKQLKIYNQKSNLSAVGGFLIQIMSWGLSSELDLKEGLIRGDGDVGWDYFNWVHRWVREREREREKSEQ